MTRALGALGLASAALLSACAPALAGGQEPRAALPAVAPATEPAAIPPGKAPPSGPYAPSWDVLHYDLEIALPEGPGWIAGHARIGLARSDVPDTVLRLDLVGLAAQRVTVNGGDVAVDQQNGKLLVVTGPGSAGMRSTNPQRSPTTGRTARATGFPRSTIRPTRRRSR